MSKTYRVSLTKINKLAKERTPEVSKIYYARDGTHKYEALVGYEDFLTHGNEERRKRYLARHKARENWNKPSPGRYSARLLW